MLALFASHYDDARRAARRPVRWIVGRAVYDRLLLAWRPEYGELTARGLEVLGIPLTVDDADPEHLELECLHPRDAIQQVMDAAARQFGADTWHHLRRPRFEDAPREAGTSFKQYLARLEPATPDADRLIRDALGE